ncbi:MAG: CDP-alcohol phosphatidyltransferase family protein, partial [Planctomycetales bacterium]
MSGAMEQTSDLDRPANSEPTHGWEGELRYCAGGLISNWYLRPVAWKLAHVLKPTRARPTHLTLLGLAVACSAGVALHLRPDLPLAAAALVLVAYFLDLADGALARIQKTSTAWGAWLDANVDEIMDVGWRLALTSAAIQLTGQAWLWTAFAGFLIGKYLFMYSLSTDPQATPEEDRILVAEAPPVAGWLSGLKTLYHLPANSDFRLHLLLVALIGG